MTSFELGQIVITDAAQAVLTTEGIAPLQLIARYRKKDWGKFCPMTLSKPISTPCVLGGACTPLTP